MSNDCFADEIAIDFPSVEPAVERMRDAFLGERPDDDDVLRREVRVSRREAWDGLVGADRRADSRACAGTAAAAAKSGPSRARDCHGTGAALLHHAVRLTLPPGVADGARFRFRVSSPGAEPVRVEVRVAITNRVIE